MATHPILTATCAVGILLGAVAPFTMQAGEAPAPMPAAVPPATWSPPAQALLPYLDPAASFRLALDLETLRPQLRQAKPFSLVDDPRIAAEVAALPGRIEQMLGRLNPKERFFTGLWLTMVAEGRGLTYAARDASSAKPRDQRMLAALDAGPAAARVVERFDAFVAAIQQERDALLKAESERRQRPLPPQPARPEPRPLGPFAEKFRQSGTFAGCEGPRLCLASDTWLAERVGAAPAMPPPAGAWFSLDVGPLLARYAALSGPTGDPALVAPVLGPDWRRLKPVIEGRIAGEGTELVGSVRVSGAAPFSPLVPLSLLLGGTASLPFGDAAAWPMRRPAVGIPASVDRVASLSFGLTPPAPAQPFTKAVTQWRRNQGNQALDLVLRMLAAAWSGDLALEIRPGVPLPRAALVLGLRPGCDPVEVARQIALWLELPQGSLDQSGPLPKAAAGLTVAGQVVLTAHADRLVATWNADTAEWPGIASAGPMADAPACAVQVDLPAVARSWGPMALALVPAKERGLVPPLPVLLDHLPVWSMRWEATADGCRIDERGLPVAVILTAMAGINLVMVADPERETARDAAAPQATPTPAGSAF